MCAYTVASPYKHGAPALRLGAPLSRAEREDLWCAWVVTCAPGSLCGRWGKLAVVLQRGDHSPHLGDALEIDFRINDARRFPAVSQHLAPRIDNEGMPIGLALSRMIAAHGRCED